MRRTKFVLIVFIIVICFLGYLSWSDCKRTSEKEDAMNLPNAGFTDNRYYGDNLSDTDGNRAFPWGIEIWADAKGEGYELPESYFDNGQVQLIGHGTTYITVLAIPNPSDKPLVTAGLSYTQSFEVKLDNVQGNGVRVIHQWFDSNGPVHKIIGTDYRTFETGTSDWHTISLTKIAPSGAVTGDIIIELWGTGTVYIRNPKYHVTSIWDVMSQVTVRDIAVGLIAGFITVMLIADIISLVSFAVESLRGRHSKSSKRANHKPYSD